MVKLIKMMKDLGHRDYAHLDIRAVEERARELHNKDKPVDMSAKGEEEMRDIPDGVYALLNANRTRNATTHAAGTIDPDDAGKISVPADSLTEISENAFQDKRVLGADICGGKARIDLNTQLASALANAHERLTDEGASAEGCAQSDATMNLTLGAARNQWSTVGMARPCNAQR